MEDGDGEGAGAVGPEEDLEGCGEGGGRVVAEVFLQSGDHCGDGEPESWEEEALTVVGEGFDEIAVDDEAGGHERADCCEEGEVDDVDGQADLEQTGEFVGLVGD